MNELHHPSAYRFWTEDHVRFADLDPLGHANNNAIGTYFEGSRVDLFTRADGALGGGGKSVVLASIKIDFLSELHYPAPVRIGTKVLRIGRSSVVLGAAIFDGERCAAFSEAVCVRFDLATRRPAEVSDSLRRLLTELAG